MIENDIPPCLIYIDKEGRWFHEGIEMIHREFIRAFYEKMEIDSSGRYIIAWGDELCYVEVEDTPFVVQRVVFQNRKQDNQASYILFLSNDSREDLRPDTLFIRKENVLYCKVKNQRFPARFTRAAYYELGEYIEEENGVYYLPLNGSRHVIGEMEE